MRKKEYTLERCLKFRHNYGFLKLSARFSSWSRWEGHLRISAQHSCLLHTALRQWTNTQYQWCTTITTYMCHYVCCLVIVALVCSSICSVPQTTLFSLAFSYTCTSQPCIHVCTLVSNMFATQCSLYISQHMLLTAMLPNVWWYTISLPAATIKHCIMDR